MPANQPVRKSGPPSSGARRGVPPARGPGARPPVATGGRVPAGGGGDGEGEGGGGGGGGGGGARRPAPAPEAPRPAGLPLGIKFALMIAGTVAVASLLLILFARQGTVDATNDEINDAGVRLVRTLACIDFAFWEEVGTKGVTQRVVEGVSQRVQAAGSAATAKPPATPADKQAQAFVVDTFNQVLADLGALPREKAEDPLARMGDPDAAQVRHIRNPDILDLVIIRPGGGALCHMNKTERVEVPDARFLAEKDDVRISEGRYTSATYSGPTRLFRKPILDGRGATQGEVWLFLKAAKIDEVNDRLLRTLLLAGALAVAIGAVMGFFLAGLVSRPVRTLLRDIQAVAEGDLDHQTRPTSRDEVGIVALALDSMTRSLKVAHVAEVHAKSIEHELNIATEIQSNLLPRKIPKLPGSDISAYYRPSKEVGGDYYDFIPIDADHLGIVVADVSGKGIPGSMVMTMARAMLRMEATRNLSTADTLIKTNRSLAPDIRRGMFVTAMYMILDLKTHTLLVSSAGHNPVHVYRHKTKSFELVNPNGIALGFDKGPIFERTAKEQRIQLHPGDRFTAYTDGVVEAMSVKDEEFGDDKFYGLCQELAERESNQFINVVVKALDEHKGNREQHDDITLVTFRRLA